MELCSLELRVAVDWSSLELEVVVEWKLSSLGLVVAVELKLCWSSLELGVAVEWELCWSSLELEVAVEWSSLELKHVGSPDPPYCGLWSGHGGGVDCGCEGCLWLKLRMMVGWMSMLG